MEYTLNERDYIIYCLNEAVKYCEEQFKYSDIDRMPSASIIGLKNEEDKFTMLKNFLNTL